MAIYKLGDISKIISGSKVDCENGDIPVVGSGGIFGWTNKSKTTKESVSLPRKGTMKIIYYSKPVWNVDTAFLIEEVDTSILELKYLYYVLLDEAKWFQIISGSTRPATTITAWRKLELELPDINIQKKIIDIIEQTEELFLKYSNTVRIDSFNNCKKDLNKLIDIIEPLELLKESILKSIRINNDLITKIIFNNKKNRKISDISEIHKYNKLIVSALLNEKGKYFYNTGKVLNHKKKTNEKNFKIGVSIPYEGSVIDGDKLSPSLHEEDIYIARKWGIKSEYYKTIFYTLKNTSSTIAENGVKMPKLSLESLGDIEISTLIDNEISILHEISKELYDLLNKVEIILNKSMLFLIQ